MLPSPSIDKSANVETFSDASNKSLDRSNVATPTTPVMTPATPSKTTATTPTPTASTSVVEQSATVSKSILSPFQTPQKSGEHAGEKVLSLRKVLSYNGGTLGFLYNGTMIVSSVGSSIILIEVYDAFKDALRPRHGLWKAFSTNVDLNDTGTIYFVLFDVSNCII